MNSYLYNTFIDRGEFVLFVESTNQFFSFFVSYIVSPPYLECIEGGLFDEGVEYHLSPVRSLLVIIFT